MSGAASARRCRFRATLPAGWCTTTTLHQPAHAGRSPGIHNMRVLITGGYGFIGAWIIRNLLAQGDQIWVYDLKEDARRLRPIMPESDVKKVVFVQGDVTDQPTLQKAIAAHQISHIIHLAGLQVP